MAKLSREYLDEYVDTVKGDLKFAYQKLPTLGTWDNLDEQAFLQIKEIIQLKQASREWKPTPENINALPEPLRKFIHDIETNCDPPGLMRENVLLKDENEALRLKLKQPKQVTTKEILDFAFKNAGQSNVAKIYGNTLELLESHSFEVVEKEKP